MPQCAIFRMLATVIDYFSLLVTACHRLFTYHCPAPVIAGKNEHRLVATIRWKEQASSRSRIHVFHPDEFYVHRLQVKVHPGVHACGFRFSFSHVRTYVWTDTTKCKYR